MYANGEGVSRNYSAALEWLLKGADLGLGNVGFHLGMMFEDGYAAPMDKQKALLWYYQWDRSSKPVEKLKMQGYHLLPSEKGVCIYFTNAFLYNRP
jgi:hypothetical protein